MSGVRLDLQRVSRWCNDDYEVLLLVRADEPGDLAEAVELVDRAAAEAFEILDDDGVAMQRVEPTPDGPVIVMDHAGLVRQRLAWLTELIHGLDRVGWSGVVAPVDRVKLAGDLSEAKVNAPGISAFLQVPHTGSPPGARPVWGVDVGATGALVPALVAWALDGARDHLLTYLTVSFRVPTRDVARHLVWGCENVGCGQLESAVGAGLRTLRPAPNGQLVATATVEFGQWRPALDDARAAPVTASSVPRAGFVRRRQPHAGSWRDLTAGGLVPEPPFAAPEHVRMPPEGWRDRIADVHGVQLLSDEQLRRVRSLDGWSVDEVAPGCHLVEAEDLEAWYGGPGPVAGVLAAARRQFADLLLPRVD